MWIDRSLFSAPPELDERARCRTCAYPDVLKALLGLKQIFHLPQRAPQGFALSMRKLAIPGLPVPNYTTLSRRAQALAVALPVLQTGEPLHLSVYGEDKWEVRKRGWSRRRTWGLAMDANTGQSCVALTILQDEGDGKVLPRLLDQISADVAIDTIGNDGAYESETCHARIAAGPTVPSNPRREGATPWPESTLSASLARSQQVADVNGIGGWLPSSLAG